MTAKVVSGETLLRDLEQRIRLADLEQARRGGNLPGLWNLDVLGALERGLEEFQEEDTVNGAMGQGSAGAPVGADEASSVDPGFVYPRRVLQEYGFGVAPRRVIAEVEVLENGYLVSLRGGWGPELRRVAMSPRQAGEAVRALLEAYAMTPEVAAVEEGVDG